MRLFIFILLSCIFAVPAFAKERTYTVDVDSLTIVVRITESIDNVSIIRAECVIPVGQKVVWNVLTDYEHLDTIVPIIDRSDIIDTTTAGTILDIEGRAGLWFVKRGFATTLIVREVPMAYIGFEAGEGDFEKFSGAWQIAARDGGTWVAHRVEVKPRFFAPGWATRKVARRLMEETIDGVIKRALHAATSDAEK